MYNIIWRICCFLTHLMRHLPGAKYEPSDAADWMKWKLGEFRIEGVDECYVLYSRIFEVKRLYQYHGTPYLDYFLKLEATEDSWTIRIPGFEYHFTSSNWF